MKENQTIKYVLQMLEIPGPVGTSTVTFFAQNDLLARDLARDRAFYNNNPWCRARLYRIRGKTRRKYLIWKSEWDPRWRESLAEVVKIGIPWQSAKDCKRNH